MILSGVDSVCVCVCVCVLLLKGSGKFTIAACYAIRWRGVFLWQSFSTSNGAKSKEERFRGIIKGTFATALFLFKGSYDAILRFPFSLECYKLFMHV